MRKSSRVTAYRSPIAVGRYVRAVLPVGELLNPAGGCVPPEPHPFPPLRGRFFRPVHPSTQIPLTFIAVLGGTSMAFARRTATRLVNAFECSTTVIVRRTRHLIRLAWSVRNSHRIVTSLEPPGTLPTLPRQSTRSPFQAQCAHSIAFAHPSSNTCTADANAIP